MISYRIFNAAELVQIAAVGNDGVRPVVWGLGATEDEAEADAREHLSEFPGWQQHDALTYHPITEAQAQAIRDGDVSWPVEGLK